MNNITAGGCMVKNAENICSEIREVKRKLAGVGDMRPGVLSRQVSVHNGKKYWQISYTHKMKSKTEYVRADQAERLKAEVKEFKKFKVLVKKWADAALELSRLKSALAKLGKLEK